MLLFSGAAFADVADVYDFDSAQQEERFQSLIEELRCPKCQNQNIADSNAPIARDMRDEAYRMMRDGASEDQIVDSLVARFGEFILYKPAVEKRTILLWATPFIAVFGGLLVVIGVVVRSRQSGQKAPALSAEEKARAAQILDGDEQDNRS
ncbi:cytochrome c-type biogenesis protein [Marinobacter salinexigens]|nr:cytochrome c-type biogenesis protein [Marinobacter salinexigens]